MIRLVAGTLYTIYAIKYFDDIVKIILNPLLINFHYNYNYN